MLKSLSSSFIKSAVVAKHVALKRQMSVATICDTIIPTTVDNLPVVTELKIVNTKETNKIPVFRILGPSGKIIEGAEEPEIDETLARKLYQFMVRIQHYDEIMYNAQRQGRISFYMQASGEEAIHIGMFSRSVQLKQIFFKHRYHSV